MTPQQAGDMLHAKRTDAPTPYGLTVHLTARDIALRAAGITQFIAVPAPTPEHADTPLQEAS